MYRLMIADDEETIRNGVAHSLPWEALGFEIVALCENGQQVLDKLDECRPDVVLSDIRMPIADGVQLMKQLNQKHPEIKIVILSGYSDFEYLNESIKNHVTEYLLKPTDVDEFEDVFRRLKLRLDEEHLRNAEIDESVHRHFQLWLRASLRGTASAADTERFLPMLNQKRIDLDNLVVVVFTLAGHGADERPDRAALWRKILAVGERQPHASLSRLLVPESDEQLIALYSSANEIADEQVVKEVQALQLAVQKALGETLSAGVSNLCTEPDMLPQAFEQANCCAQQGVFVGQGGICRFAEINTICLENLVHFDTDVLEKALLAQDYSALRDEADRVFSAYDVPMRNYRYLDQICLSLLFHISLWGLRYSVRMEEVLRTLGATYTDVFSCDTLQAKRTFVLAILFAFQKALGNRREQGHIANSVAMRVRDYVDHNFASNTISLESVAAHVHKTAAYISRLFKNELGTNFSDYLTQKRMQMATQLLQNPDARVYTVAQQCGYADPSHFIRVFKRFYGISPAEYRAVQGECV